MTVGGMRSDDDLDGVTDADFALLLSSPSNALFNFLRSATEDTRTGAAASGGSCVITWPLALWRSCTFGPDAFAALVRYRAHQMLLPGPVLLSGTASPRPSQTEPGGTVHAR